MTAALFEAVDFLGAFLPASANFLQKAILLSISLIVAGISPIVSALPVHLPTNLGGFLYFLATNCISWQFDDIHPWHILQFFSLSIETISGTLNRVRFLLSSVVIFSIFPANSLAVSQSFTAFFFEVLNSSFAAVTDSDSSFFFLTSPVLMLAWLLFGTIFDRKVLITFRVLNSVTSLSLKSGMSIRVLRSSSMFVIPTSM